MDDALHIALRLQRERIHRHALRGGLFKFFEVLLDKAPDASEETVRPFDSALGPVEIFLRRGREKNEEARGIRAILFYYLVWVDDVADRL